jgi:hypothetical protein
MVWIIVAVVALALLLASPFLVRGVRSWRAARRLADAKDAFHRQREHLEIDFLKKASGSGKPRGLRWVDCEFADEVTYARDRARQSIVALVAVTVSFEAVEGGGMEEVEAVGNLRAATAVFYYAGGQWTTDGRVVFNLEPREAVAYYDSQLELIPE